MTRYRICLVAGCGVITTGSRCPAHERRQSSTHNGNYAEHRRWREQLEATLPALCAGGCGKILEPDGDWVAAHERDGDPSSARLAMCRADNERMKRR